MMGRGIAQKVAQIAPESGILRRKVSFTERRVTMKGRRIVAVFLMVAMVMAGLYVTPVEKVRAETAQIDNFVCSLLSDGTISVDSYYGSEEEIVVPAELGGYKVSQVGSGEWQGDCFGSYELKTIIISPGIKYISNNAFNSNFTSLERVVIPDSIVSIGFKAFAYNDKLNDIVIPDSVERIENDTFSGCESLSNITLPKTLNSIGNNAFLNCKSLRQITLGNTLSSIGDKAFYNTALSEITIPSDIEYIGDYAIGYHDGTFGEEVKTNDFIIRGISESVTEEYALENGFAFDAKPRAKEVEFSPEVGMYRESQTVSLTCATPNATIFYSIPDSDGTNHWVEYTEPIEINETTKLYAYATAEGYAASKICGGVFEIDYLAPDKIIGVGEKITIKVGKKLRVVAAEDSSIVKVKKKGKKIVIIGKAPGTTVVLAYDKRDWELGAWIVKVE